MTFIARHFKVETGITGKSKARPNPFTVAAPIRSPVKDPGPLVIAMASKSEGVFSHIFIIWSIIGNNVAECVFLLLMVSSDMIFPSSHIATDSTFPELSIARSLRLVGEALQDIDVIAGLYVGLLTMENDVIIVVRLLHLKMMMYLYLDT